ncbi:MAG: hypothetical protein Tsb0013_21600 [Phycisphaerales bacterium]
MTSRRQFHLGLAITLVGVVGICVSIPWLVAKLRERNVTTMRLVAQFEAPAFEIAGEEFRVERVPPLEEGEVERENGDPDAALRVHWRGQTHDFALGPNNKPYEPGLKAYGLWFGVLLLADGAATEEEFERMWTEGGAVEPYFVAAARYPAEGYDPETWGKVRRQEWMYEFVRFRFDGDPEDAIEVARKPYEQVDALYLPGKYTEERYLPTADERQRDLWQYYASTYVTPPGQFRGRNKVIDPLMRDMGLAWPAAGVSILTIVVGSLILMMGTRGRA